MDIEAIVRRLGDWPAEILSEHPNEAEAKRAGHALLHLLGGMPPGWALAVCGDDANGWKLVKYPALCSKRTKAIACVRVSECACHRFGYIGRERHQARPA